MKPARRYSKNPGSRRSAESAKESDLGTSGWPCACRSTSAIHSRRSVEYSLLGAQDSGDQAEVQRLQKQVASLQRVLDQYDRELHGKLSSLDPTLDKWLTRSRFLQQQAFGLRQRIAVALGEQEAAAEAVKGVNARRTAVDGQLNDAIAQLTTVDFIPDEVTVTDAGGHVVFRADLSKTAFDLRAIERELEPAKEAQSELERQRKLALQDFLQAGRKASASLAHVADVIWSVAKKKAAVDFAYKLYDVGKAAAKGGLVGAVAETVKKVGEAVVKEYFDVGPGQLAAELRHPLTAHAYLGELKDLDATYQADAKLTNHYFADQARKVAVERPAKDSVSGPGKDVLNEYVGAALHRWWRNLELPKEAYGPSQKIGYLAQFKKEAQWIRDNYKLWIAALTKHKDHLKELSKGSKLLNALSLVKAGAPKNVLKPVAGDLLAGFFKDLSKNIWKRYFDLQEQQAWTDFFEKEAAAQALFLPWQQSSAVYDSVHEYVHGLEAEKAKLLAGYDPATGTRVLLDRQFDEGTKLRITLKLVCPAGATNVIHFDVSLGGSAPSAAGPYEYAASTRGLAAGSHGLGLKISVP